MLGGLSVMTGCGTLPKPLWRGGSVELTPRYTDAFDMRYGLFIHWVGCSPTQNSGLRHSNGASIGTRRIDEYADSIDVEKVADEMVALGFEYVLITDFHGFGTMLHPSVASDLWRGRGYASKRDLIGEMVAALRKRGIGFVLFTHPVAGHTYTKEDQEKLGWNDPTDNYKRWNDFINDIYAELAERYGNEMMGMGFDREFGLSGNEDFQGKLDLGRLRETILSKAPNLQLYALAGPNETCEFGHREVWRANWHSPWMTKDENDYDVETWPAYRRVVSVVLPNHWATITPPKEGMTHLNAEQLYRYTVLQAATATEGPGSAWAASPYADGSWEKGVREVFADVAAYMKDVRTSLTRVYPSTSYPTPEGAMLSKLPHGIVATKATDGSAEYIHVLNPPAGNRLSLPLPEDGKVFASATLLANGKAVGLVQKPDGLELILDDKDSWDKLNTVIALGVDSDTIPRRNLALHQKVTASDGMYIAKLPANSDVGRIRLTDGQKHVTGRPEKWATGNLGWSSARRETNGSQWVSVHLADEHTVGEVRLYPRSDAGHEGSGLPIDLRADVSLNGRTWQTVASRNGLPQSSETLVLTFDPARARYVRVVGTELRPAPQDGLFSMQFVELEVFSPR